jgi:hypothetical protein
VGRWVVDVIVDDKLAEAIDEAVEGQEHRGKDKGRQGADGAKG